MTQNLYIYKNMRDQITFHIDYQEEVVCTRTRHLYNPLIAGNAVTHAMIIDYESSRNYR